MDFGDVFKAWKEDPSKVFRIRDAYGLLEKGSSFPFPGNPTQLACTKYPDGTVKLYIAELTPEGRWTASVSLTGPAIFADWEEVDHDEVVFMESEYKAMDDAVMRAQDRRWKEMMQAIENRKW